MSCLHWIKNQHGRGREYMKLDCRKWIKMLLYIRLLLTFCIVNSYSVVSLTGSNTQWFFRFCWTLQYCSELGQHLSFRIQFIAYLPNNWSVEMSHALGLPVPIPSNSPCLPPSFVIDLQLDRDWWSTGMSVWACVRRYLSVLHIGSWCANCNYVCSQTWGGRGQSDQILLAPSAKAQGE